MVNHAFGLLIEYQDRFGRKHATSTAIQWMSKMDGFLPIGDLLPDPFVQAMPDKYKQQSAVLAYRDYYRGEKASFAKWERGTPAPFWY